jgi:hypothetical protein
LIIYLFFGDKEKSIIKPPSLFFLLDGLFILEVCYFMSKSFKNVKNWNWNDIFKFCNENSTVGPWLSRAACDYKSYGGSIVFNHERSLIGDYDIKDIMNLITSVLVIDNQHSYRLKHTVERILGRYVWNSDLIVFIRACKLLGLNHFVFIKVKDDMNLDGHFNADFSVKDPVRWVKREYGLDVLNGNSDLVVVNLLRPLVDFANNLKPGVDDDPDDDPDDPDPVSDVCKPCIDKEQLKKLMKIDYSVGDLYG